MKESIVVEHLEKLYSPKTGAQDITFSVREGEIFGLVGPNGAGKSTTVECLIGLRRPDRGEIRVLGLDPQKDKKELSQRIGVQLQQAELPDSMKVWEALQLFSTFYRQAAKWETLLEQWGLSEKRNTAFGKLSGGQKQRLFIALALLNNPEVVFLDELTTALDPQARRNTWELIEAVRDSGKTVVLVTHFMEEAERLCDRLGIVDATRLIAIDTPQALIQKSFPGSRVRFRAPENFQAEWLAALPGIHHVSYEGNTIVVSGEEASGTLLAKIVAAIGEHNAEIQDLQVEKATLEDVFLKMTGKKIRE